MAFIRRFGVWISIAIAILIAFPFLYGGVLSAHHWMYNTSGIAARSAQNELEKVRGDVNDKKIVADVTGRIDALRDRQAILSDAAKKSGNSDELNRVGAEIADLEREQAYNAVRAAEIEGRAAKSRKMVQDVKDCGADLECVHRIEKANQPKISIAILEQQDKATRDAEMKRLVDEAFAKKCAEAEAAKKKATIVRAPQARHQSVAAQATAISVTAIAIAGATQAATPLPSVSKANDNTSVASSNEGLCVCRLVDTSNKEVANFGLKNDVDCELAKQDFVRKNGGRVGPRH